MESGSCTKVVKQVISEGEGSISVIILIMLFFIFLLLVSAWKIFAFVPWKVREHFPLWWRPYFSMWLWHWPSCCTGNIDSVQRERPRFSQTQVYTTLETMFFKTFCFPAAVQGARHSMTLGRITGEGKGKVRRRSVQYRETENNHHCSTLLGFLERLGGFNNIHLSSSKFMNNWKSGIASEI